MASKTKESAILVLGTGQLGEALLVALVPKSKRVGMRIDVLVRPGDDVGATFVRSLGATPIEGDIAAASEADIAAWFCPYDTVVGCIGFAAGKGTQLKLARAALSSGIRRYFPWQFGADYDRLGRGSPQPLFDEQLDVRDLLRAQDSMRWVIVSVGMFTSFLFEPSFGVVDLRAGTVRALGSWDNAVTLTTPEDIGYLTAEIILAEPEFADVVVYLAGDTISYGDLADVVERELGRPIDRLMLTTEVLAADLAKDPDDTMRRYRAVFAVGRGMWWDQKQTFNAQRNIRVTDTKDWLRRHLAKGNAGVAA